MTGGVGPRRPTVRSVGVAAGLGLLLTLTAACGGKDLPESVVEGSEVAVAWSRTFTSTNPAAAVDATPGNVDVAALTRSRFGEVVAGEVVTDPSFGTVEVTGTDPFTVRYDLAEPTWSDGIPLDATDLLLAWAAASDGDGGFDAVPTGLAASDGLVGFDESERAIEVRFDGIVNGAATALDVAVPAHVLGQLALGIEDPMEAKKAVADAIRDEDAEALAGLAEAWNGDFRISPDAETEDRLLLSSGPYRISAVTTADAGGLRVELVANPRYSGARKPSYERIALTEMVDADKLAALGDTIDVAQFGSTEMRRKPVTASERRDHSTITGHDGTMWILALRADRGPFTSRKARAAFLRAVPRTELVEAGGGAWADTFVESTTLLFAPDAAGHDIAVEDSGFASSLGVVSDDPAAERTAAGVAPGTSVCLLHDRASSFVQRSFSVLREAVAAAGWMLRDCGVSDLGDLSAVGKDWDAAMVRIPVPRDAADLTRLWGGDGASVLTGATAPERDELIDRWSTTLDRYDARDLLVAIEKSVVDDALAVPLAMNPVVVVSVPEVDGVSVRPDPVAPLTSGMAEWSLTRQ